MKILITVLLIFFISCSLNDQSGNGSETTNHIAGILIFDDSTKAIGAQVSLYQLEGSPKTLTLLKETLSDKKGAYEFSNLAKGDYSLVAKHLESKSSWVVNEVIELGEGEKSEVRGLMQKSAFIKFNPDSLSEKIPFELGDKWSLIFNETYGVELLDKDTLYEIPPGNYVLSYRVENQEKVIAKDYSYDSIDVDINDTISLKEINPYRLIEEGSLGFVENFEDKGLSTDFGSIWWVFDDSNEGAFSTIEYSSEEKISENILDSMSINNSQWAVHLNYAFKKDQSRFVGFGIDFTPYPHHLVSNLNNIDSLHFKYKGIGKAKLKVCLTSLFSISVSPECKVVSESLDLDSKGEWTQIKTGWFKPSELNEPELLTLNNHFLFMLIPSIDEDIKGELWLDDIYLGS